MSFRTARKACQANIQPRSPVKKIVRTPPEFVAFGCGFPQRSCQVRRSIARRTMRLTVRFTPTRLSGDQPQFSARGASLERRKTSAVPRRANILRRHTHGTQRQSCDAMTWRFNLCSILDPFSTRYSQAWLICSVGKSWASSLNSSAASWASRSSECATGSCAVAHGRTLGFTRMEA